MKKNTIYILVAALAGLLVGYLFFGISASNENSADAHDQTMEGEGQMWTCSMHPQIMQAEPGDCPICGMDLIPAKTGADGLGPDQIVMTENAMALANIRTTVVGAAEGETGTSLSLSGKIAVNEEAVAVQASYFDGRIEQLNVNYEGQEIQKGQLLATIYSPELVAAQQELITAVALKESKPQLYEAVRNKLKLWKLSGDQISSIENTGLVRDYLPVYATVSGTVTAVMSAEGDYIKQGQPIVKVSNLNTVWAAFDAYESQLSQFKTGQKISIKTNAYPDKVFEAKLSFISPVLDNASRTVTVRATLDNKSGLFKPGMFVTGIIDKAGIAEGETQLVIPASAVLWTGKRSLVYVRVKDDQPVFEMREVTLGDRSGNWHTITSGLNRGEEIVANGTFTVDAAAQLQGKRSMMNPEGGVTVSGHEGHSGLRQQDKGAPGAAGMAMQLPETFQDDFQAVFPLYLQMKDAFVASDAGAVAREANSLADKMSSLNAASLGSMEKAHFDKTVALLRKISGSKVLQDQRAFFVDLNQQLVVFASHLDLSRTLYVQLCPMANNNQGAIWLSAEEEIRNPYYGDEMLSCGKVEQVLN